MGRNYRRKPCSGWGRYADGFRRFLESGDRTRCMEYADTEDAAKAQKAMLNLMNRDCIYDVSIRRKGNVLRLEKTGADGRMDYREHILGRFMRVL